MEKRTMETVVGTCHSQMRCKSNANIVGSNVNFKLFPFELASVLITRADRETWQHVLAGPSLTPYQ
jgi:hypothetical protein